jgi:anti-sigma regulatory factor (Ser/Thr protein kinase)
MSRRAVREDLGDVGSAVEWAGLLASEAGLSEEMRFSIEVCLEEALVNLVLHGEAADGGKDIAVDFGVGSTGCTVLVTDRCAPYDVVNEALPDREGEAVMREGGRGLMLLRAFATELAYASEQGRNALRMTFRSPPDGAPSASRSPEPSGL